MISKLEIAKRDIFMNGLFFFKKNNSTDDEMEIDFLDF